MVSEDDLQSQIRKLKLEFEEISIERNALLLEVEELTQLSENLQQGILVETMDRKISRANHFFCQLFKMPRERSIIGCFGSEIHQKIAEYLLDSFSYLTDTSNFIAQQKTTKNNILFLKDGRVFERDYIPLYLQNKIDGNIWIYRDITLPFKAEQKLKESEKNFRLLFEHSPLGTYIAKKDGVIVDANKALLEMLGSPSVEATKTINILTYQPLIQNGYVDKFNECINTGKIIAHELDYISKWGKKVYLSSYIIPLKNESGSVDNIYTIMEDITARKVSEFALKESEQKLKIAQQTAHIGHWELNFNTNKLYLSDEIFHILGIQAQSIELTYVSFRNYVHPEDREFVFTSFQNSLKEKSDFNLVYRLKIVNGMIKYINERSKTIFDEQGKAISSVGTIADISHIIDKEQQIEQQNKQLKNLVESKDKFFSIIAHDLKNPFNVLIGLSDLITKNFDNYSDEKIKNLISNINQVSNQTFVLLQDLLTWSRSEQNLIPYNPQTFDIMSFINDEIIVYKSMAIAKNISLKSFIDKEIFVFADKNMLSAILRNLIQNAIKFSEHYQNIFINTFTNSKFVDISVIDFGVGMSTEQIDNLLNSPNPVSRQGTDNETGTGLGLSICKEFIKKHGGELKIQSEENKGSSFTFSIPLMNEIL